MMDKPCPLALLSPKGNLDLERTLRDAGFEVLVVSEESDVPPGIVVLDLLPPEQARLYLCGDRDGPQEFRERGYTVIVAVSSEILSDDRAIYAIASAHAFLLPKESPGSVRATIFAGIRRRELDDSLKKSERRYRLLAEHVGDVIWTWDLQAGRFDFISPSIVGLRGFTVEEALGQTLPDSMTPESVQKVLSHIAEGEESLRKGILPASLTDYYDQPCKDGTVKTVEITTSLVYDAEGRPFQVLGVSRDATERVRNKAALEAALRQHEVLFAELEHRVKNTLAMIASLLSLAAAQVRDPRDAVLFEESQTRVAALALIYQKLLSASDAARIDLGVYLEDLCRSVTSTFIPDEGRVDLGVDRKEVTVDSKKAALIGLTVNEMITNSLKYAIGPDKPLRLWLEVAPAEGGGFRVAFRDDGPGLPPGFDVNSSGGLGFLLVRSLVSQLKGEITTESSEAGTRFCLSIPA